MGTYSFLLNYSIYSTKKFRTEVALKNLEYVFSQCPVLYLLESGARQVRFHDRMINGDSTYLKPQNGLELMFWFFQSTESDLLLLENKILSELFLVKIIHLEL